MRAALLALTALAAAGVILCTLAVRSTFPRESGTQLVAGIGGRVQIETDAQGIVTIRANRPLDAIFGIGYAHARDRLWQMDFQRRIGSGRLSEILGKRLVETDRFLRTIGFRRAAEQALRSLAPGARAQLDAYVAGVNQFLATSGSRPIEFRLLRFSPELFSAADCLVWAKMMAWDLASVNAADEIRRAGSRTKSGRPILANDPHLGLRTPSVWYLARLEAPGLSVAGATLPGIPNVIIGHNARIAWGLTSLEPDVQEIYLEETDPKDGRRYLHAGVWRTFETRTETIRVRGDPDFVFEIRSSVHGPIVTDALEGAKTLGTPAVALRWTGLDPQDTTAEALAAINVAGGWNEFLSAASRLRSPAQNLVYADVDGHIGYTGSGAIPIRPRADGLLPLSGAGADDWLGYIPFEELPHVLDPPRGFLVTANNRVASERYSHSMTRDWPEPYRARRITDLLLSRPLWAPEDLGAIQLDRVSYQAADLLPLLLDTRPEDAGAARALASLRAWNGEFSPDSVPASIYAAWYAKLSEMPQDELKDVPAGNVRSRFLVNALKANSAWCDDVRTSRKETCAVFKAMTLARALETLRQRLGEDSSRWNWQRLHRARFPHGVFDRVPLLRAVFNLETGAGGDASTVNVGAYRRDGSFLMTDGPTYRQILDLADFSRSLYVHTTGQSGNVFDRRYRNLLPFWRDGRYFRIGEPPVYTLTFVPRK